MVTEVIKEGVEVPLETLKSCTGVAIDFGFSTIKIVYRPRSLYSNGALIGESEISSRKGPLHMALFPSEALAEVIEYIKEQCDILQTEDKHIIHVCGRGLNKETKGQLEKGLNCQIICDNAVDALGDGLRYLLKSGPGEKLFYAPETEGIELGEKMAEVARVITLDSERFDVKGMLPINLKDESPIIVADMGATFRFIKVGLQEGDYTTELLGEIDMGGRFFHGICGFFCGKKDFASVRTMAEECDGRTVEVILADYFSQAPTSSASSSSETFYEKLADFSGDAILSHLRAFNMEKMITGNRDDAKPGDAVQSLMNTVCENTILHLSNLAGSCGVSRICLAGSWIHSPVFRKWLTAYLMMKNNSWSMFKSPIEYEFLHHGSYLGAIGAFLR